MPYLDANRDSGFTQLDFAEMYLTQQTLEQEGGGKVESGYVSIRDLEAPAKAVDQYKEALSCLKTQNIKGAIQALQKAISIDPKFVSAHNALGLAYSDQHDARAKEEFQTATQLDTQFSAAFVNLGILELFSHDFTEAEANLSKASTLGPSDAKILTVLAFAQNASHRFEESLRTVQRIHSLRHQGVAYAHYIGAGAAQSLHDYDNMRKELNLFLQEDPGNPLAPVAHNYLNTLAARAGSSRPGSISQAQTLSIAEVNTFPNTDRLKTELSTVGDYNDTDADDCAVCNTPAAQRPPLALDDSFRAAPNPPTLSASDAAYTIHQAVDETVLFLSVSHGGHMINDLSASDIQIRDDKKPPARVLAFVPQSQLPLRLGVLVDVSGSVEHRLGFEKRAAEQFIDRLLNRQSDLAFVASFASDTYLSQDFTPDAALLTRSVDKFPQMDDGTALFDAIYYSCWKLNAYPDEVRTAKVLVVLTDGEDNASHRSLAQTLEEAELAGVTIFTVSTADHEDPRLVYPTDADKILRVMAERSGGEYFQPVNIRELDYELNKLRDTIRSRYLIAYRAADFVPDGRYHTIQITAQRDGKRFKVHTRKGYYARTAQAQELRAVRAQPAASPLKDGKSPVKAFLP